MNKYNPCDVCPHAPYNLLRCPRECAYGEALEKQKMLETVTKKQAEALGGPFIQTKEALSHAIADMRELLQDDYHELSYISVSWAIHGLRHMLEYQKPLTLEQLKSLVPQSQDMVQERPREWIWISIRDPSGLLKGTPQQSAYYLLACNCCSDNKNLCCSYPGHIYEFDYATYGKVWVAFKERPES